MQTGVNGLFLFIKSCLHCRLYRLEYGLCLFFLPVLFPSFSLGRERCGQGGGWWSTGFCFDQKLTFAGMLQACKLVSLNQTIEQINNSSFAACTKVNWAHNAIQRNPKIGRKKCRDTEIGHRERCKKKY